MQESNKELFSNQLARKIAVRVGAQLLERNAYVDLKVEDLVYWGAVGENESFTDAMERMLALNKRISKASWELLKLDLPQFTEEKDQTAIVPNIFISEKEEQNARLKAFYMSEVADESGIDEIQAGKNLAKYDLQTLSLEIVNAIKSADNTLELDESLQEEITDPQEIFRNLPVDAFMNVEPKIVVVPQLGFCFALSIPEEEEAITPHFVSPSLKDYLIVLNPRLNAQLTQFVLESKPILKYLLLQEIKKSQAKLIDLAGQKFNSIALEKYPEMERAVEEITSPLRKHIYRLLEKETEDNKEVYLTEIFRDRLDVAAILAKSETKEGRFGSESGARQFRIRQNEQNELLFNWEGLGFAWEVDFSVAPPRKNMVHANEKREAIVVMDDEEKFTFKDTPKLVNRKITEGLPKRVDKDSEDLQRFFQAISGVFDVEQLGAKGRKGVEEAQQFISQLCLIDNLPELFSQLRSTDIYPNLEYLFSREQRHYLVEVFPKIAEEKLHLN